MKHMLQQQQKSLALKNNNMSYKNYNINRRCTYNIERVFTFYYNEYKTKI